MEDGPTTEKLQVAELKARDGQRVQPENFIKASSKITDLMDMCIPGSAMVAKNFDGKELVVMENGMDSESSPTKQTVSENTRFLKLKVDYRVLL